MSTQEILIWIGGLLHFCLLAAVTLVPRALNWRAELESVSNFSRHLIWVHGIFIAMVIVAFGLIALTSAHELTGGAVLARSMCAFIAVFWLSRLGVQLFLFDAAPYLSNWFFKTGYHFLTFVFTYLGVVFAWAAVLPAGKGVTS